MISTPTFTIENAVKLLSRTPQVLDLLLRDLPEKLTLSNEGPGSWSPFDIMGHFIHGEHTDWIPRARIILEESNGSRFEVFDREAQFNVSYGEKMEDLLIAFANVRARNVETLLSWKLSSEHLEKQGIHPEFGAVTLRQHLSMWMAHDLVHMNQMLRVMARQLKDEVGPFKAYVNLFGENQALPPDPTA